MRKGPTEGTLTIRRYLLKHIGMGSKNVVRDASKEFDISRQAIHRHLSTLETDGQIEGEGATRARTYRLKVLGRVRFTQPLADMEEDVVWRRLEPLLGPLTDNARSIWTYGFTEMVNNAIEHSQGAELLVVVERTAGSKRLGIFDDGIGIFRKIQQALGLEEESAALLDLSMGKFTTDPENHTGEGIFFTSRMFDEFQIDSRGTTFSHDARHEFGLLDLDRGLDLRGTAVRMALEDGCSRTTEAVFNKFSGRDDDYGFRKTIIPVRLVAVGQERLISRSQARRLLARFDMFDVVILDFEGVSEIGQAFADEIFRVYSARNRSVKIVPANARGGVKRMITRARRRE